MEWRNIFVWGVPSLVMGYISYVYFKADSSDASLKFRIATAAHGVSAAILYLSAWLVSALTAGPRLDLAAILLALYAVPVGLTVISMGSYRGPRSMHALQFINVPVMLYTAFIGLVLVAVREI